MILYNVHQYQSQSLPLSNMSVIDNHKDKKKVLHGGAWSFEKAPILLEEYDRMRSISHASTSVISFVLSEN